MFKTAVGYFFLQLSIFGLVINLGALFPLRKIMRKGDSQCVYFIAIVTILNDMINLVVNCCYFAPTIIASNYILADTPDAFGPLLMVSIAHFSWNNGIFLMILMVFNRVMCLVFEKKELFLKTRIIGFCAFSAILSGVKIVLDIFVLPCCVVLMDFEKFGFSIPNPNNQTDWSDWIDSPIEISVFMVTLICYIVVFIKCRTTVIHVEETLDSKHQKKVKARERSIAMQFLTISIFSMLSYASLKLTPIIFGRDHVESNIISPIVYAMGCCANACVFIFMNEEVVIGN
ncbi:unnamed protein product [Caenorhabditis brenneri]